MKRFIFFYFFIGPLFLYSQSTSVSPYSAFGLGELAPQGYDRSFAMGGIGIGFNDSLAINPLNPASYSFFKRQNPVFQVGIKGQQLTLESEINTNEVFNFNVNNFTLGFPISKKGGLVLGINPATTVGYRVAVLEEFTNGDGYTFPVVNVFEGTGGYTKFFIGGAYRLIEKRDSLLGVLSVLSFGANINYFSGIKESTVEILYEDSASSYKNTRYTENQIISDFGFQFGLQYQKYLRKKSSVDYFNLSLGATVSLPNQMNTRFESQIITFDYTSSGGSTSIDSIYFNDQIKGKSKFPLIYGVGMMIDIDNKWQFGVDYEFQNWDNYSQVINDTEFQNDVLSNTYRVGLGIQYCPVPLGARKINTSYLKMISYRVGARYEQKYLIFDDFQLDERAISLGLNLPFSKSQSLSSLNLGIEFGTSGKIDDGLIKQDFINFMIGLTLLPHRYNNWFQKRQYN